MPSAAASVAVGVWAGAAALFDLNRRRIPNTLLLLLLVPAVLALAVNGRGLLGVTPLQSLAGLLVAGLPLMPGYLLGQMGAGDIKFAACLGLLLGPAGALALLLGAALLLGGASAALLWRRGRAARSLRLPAAPAFAVAFFLALTFASQLHFLPFSP